MKQTELKTKVGISDSFLSMILDGSRRPSWRVAKRLAEATGTDPALWMEGDPLKLKLIVKRKPA